MVFQSDSPYDNSMNSIGVRDHECVPKYWPTRRPFIEDPHHVSRSSPLALKPVSLKCWTGNKCIRVQNIEVLVLQVVGNRGLINDLHVLRQIMMNGEPETHGLRRHVERIRRSKRDQEAQDGPGDHSRHRAVQVQDVHC